jgi:hypothetical protein
MSAAGYGLGRIATTDAQDAAYPLRALLAPAPALPTQKYWKTGAILDQGQTPMCVGFSARQWLTSWPVPDTGGPDAQTIYHGAQRNDDTPGEAYDGTDDRGAMKYLQSLGYVSAYHWTASAEDAATYVLTQGGLLVGVDWTEGMFTPDVHGVIRPTGKAAGGHELFVGGYNRTRGLFRLVNSWGSAWGQAGKCWLAGEDLQRLIDAGGDVCAPVQSVPARAVAP